VTLHSFGDAAAEASSDQQEGEEGGEGGEDGEEDEDEDPTCDDDGGMDTNPCDVNEGEEDAEAEAPGECVSLLRQWRFDLSRVWCTLLLRRCCLP
jgi:hypothetical protein